MKKSTFKIERMDCPTEENLIRMKLQNLDSIVNQNYDLANRILVVTHSGEVKPIETEIAKLNLNSRLLESVETTEVEKVSEDHNQRKILWIVLLINFIFFLLESTTGIFSRSMGLVADSLDMLADTLVYGLSLLAVGATIIKKKRVALFSGYFQLLLALLGVFEVIKRFIGIEELPDFKVMIGISILALLANTASLLLLQKSKDNKAQHIQASIICSSNDVITNLGVIIAGILVWLLHSSLPDLIVGSIVFVIVFRGALRILKLAK